MSPIRVADDIVPIGEFKIHAARMIERIRGSGQPLVITQHGRPAAVVLSPAEFDRLRERQRFIESVAAGVADAEAGRVVGVAEVRRRLDARRRPKRAE